METFERAHNLNALQRDVLVALRHLDGPDQGGVFHVYGTEAVVSHDYLIGSSAHGYRLCKTWEVAVPPATLAALCARGLVEQIPSRSGLASSIYRLSTTTLFGVRYDKDHPCVLERQNWLDEREREWRLGRA